MHPLPVLAPRRHKSTAPKNRHGVFDVDPTLPYFEGSHPGSHIFWRTMPLVQCWSDISWDGVLALVYRGEIIFWWWRSISQRKNFHHPAMSRISRYSRILLLPILVLTQFNFCYLYEDIFQSRYSCRLGDWRWQHGYCVVLLLFTPPINDGSEQQ